MKDRTKKPFLSRFVASLMAFLLLFTGLIPSSGSVSFADTPDPEEQMCRVRILDTEGGDLSFVHTTEKEIRLRKGDSVTVSASPKEGYVADTLSYMVGSDMDEENVKEVPFVNGLADVPITDDTVITTSFYQKPVDSVVKTMPEDVTGSLYTKSEVDAIAKGEEKTSSIKATEFYTKQPGKTPEGVVYEAVDTTNAKDVLVAPDGVYKGKPQEPASRPNGPMLRSAPVANWYDGTYTFTHMPGSSWTPLMTVTSDGNANPDFDTRLRWMFSDANRMPILGNHTSRASITNGHFSFCQNPFFKSPPSGGSYPRLISITSGSSITSESDFDKFIHLSAQYRFPGIYSTTKYSEYNNLPTNEFYYGKRCVEDDSWQLRQATKIMLLWMMLVNTAQRDPALAQRIIDATGKTQYISLDTLRDYDKIISLSWYYCADIYVLRNCGGSFRIYPITYEECSAVADIANYIAIHLNDGKFKLHNMQYNMFTAPLDGSGSQYDHHDTTNSEQQTHGQVLGWIEMQENGKLNLQKSSKTPLYSNNNSCYSLAGARYRVYDKNNSAVGTLTTTTSGKTNTLSLPVGTYTVKEISPSKGFEKNPTPSTVTIRSNQTTTLSTGAAIETPLDDLVTLMIRKTVEGKPRTSLAGIRFKLSHYAGYYTNAAAAKASGQPTCSAVFATDERGLINAALSKYKVSGDWKYKDEDGMFTSPLGTLVWEEIDTLPELIGFPNQYATVQIYNKGDSVGRKYYEKFAAPINQGGSEQKLNNDYKRANVCVYKFDQDFNASRPQGDGTLAGVTYRITRKGASDGFPAEGIEITTAWDSSRNAYVAKTKDEKHGESTGGPLVYGSYVIEEVDPSTGYANGNFHEEFTFGENGDISKNGDWMEFNDVKDKASRNAIHRGGVKFPKISVDTNDNQEGDINFSGIQFAFINRSKNNVFVEGREYKIGEVVAIRETNAEGILETENNLFPYGTYDVVELRRDSGVQVGSMYSSANKGKSPYASPAEDSVLWKENKKTFIIRQSNVVVDGEKMVNEPSRGDGALQKKDIELGFAQGDSSFAGIQYALVNASAYKSLYKGTLYAPGKVMDILTADAEGKVKSDKMPFGTYTVHELRSDHKVSIGNTFDGSDFGTSIYANNNGYLYKEFTDTKSICTNGEVIAFTNANPVVRGGMSLDKIITDTKDNQEGDINLSGIRYAIVNASKAPVYVDNKTQEVGKVVAIVTTDSEGKVTTPNMLLPYGTYKVYELKRDSGVKVGSVYTSADKGKSIYATPVEDSVLWAENEKTITIREQEKIVNVRDANEPIINAPAVGNGTIQKTDFDIEKYQGDADFEGIIYALVNTSQYKVLYNNTTYAPNQVIDVISVNKEGKASIGRIPFGTYTIHELRKDHSVKVGEEWNESHIGESIYANDKGYLYDEFTDTKSIRHNDETISFTNKNHVVRGGMSLDKIVTDTKDNEEGDVDLSGLRFAMVNVSKSPVYVDGKEQAVGNVVAIATTDKDGKFVTSNQLLPYGTYKVYELKRDSKVAVGSVWKDADKGASIYASPKEDSVLWAENEKTITIREEKKIVDVREANDPVINDVSKGNGSLQKEDVELTKAQGDADFAGVSYALVNTSKYKALYKNTLYAVGDIMDILVADKDGKVASDKMPFGTYTVHELRKDHKAEIGKAWDNSMIGKSIYANDHGYLYDEFTDTKSIRTNEEIISYTNKNRVVRGGMSLDKILVDTKDNEEGDIDFTGLRYAIVNQSKAPVYVDKKEQAVGNVVAILSTNKEGKFVSDKLLLPYGTYGVYELKRDSKVTVGSAYAKADKGESIYASPTEDSVLWAENPKTITIREQEKIVDIRDANEPVINMPANGLGKIQKTDFDITQYQGDADFSGISYAFINRSEFKVLYKNTLYKPGEIMDVFVVDKEGKADISRIPFGTYELRELRKDHKAEIGKAWDDAMLGTSIYANDKGYLYDEFTDVKSIRHQDEVISYTNKNHVVRGGLSLDKILSDTKDNEEGDVDFTGMRFAIVNRSASPVFVDGKKQEVGNVVAIVSADKVGKFTSDAKLLPYGTYDLYELRRDSGVAIGAAYDGAAFGESIYATPAGNDGVLWRENKKTITIREEGKIVDVREANDPIEDDIAKGDGSLQKKDIELGKAQGDADFAGISYAVVNSSAFKVLYKGELYEPGKVMDVLVADKDGKVASDLLPFGTYTVHELRRDHGVKVGDVFKTATLGESIYANENGYLYKEFMDTKSIRHNEERIEFTNANPVVRGGMSLDKILVDTKDNEEGNVNLEGLRFAIVNVSKASVLVDGKEQAVGNVAAIASTDKNGKFTTATSLLPYGTYKVYELKRDSKVEVGSVWKDADKGESIYASPKEDSVLWAENEKTIVIREQGSIIDVRKDNEPVINDVARGFAQIQKTDSETADKTRQGDATFEGITYALVNTSTYKVLYKGTLYAPGKVIDLLTVDALGKAKSDALVFGTYALHELRKDHTVQIGSDWSKDAIGTSIYANDHGYLYTEFTDTKSITKQDDLVTFTNANDVVRGGMKLDKILEDTKDNEEGNVNLTGLRYAIVNASEGSVVVNKKEQAVGNVVAIFATDEHGAFTTDAKLLPYGTYKVYELKRDSKVEVGNVWKDADKGESIYASPKEDSVLWAENEKTIVIREQEKIVDVRDANDPVVNKAATGFAEIQKTDTQTTTKQGDATFEGITYALVNTSTYKVLYKGTLYKPGEIIDLLKVDALGKAKSDALVFGTYDLHELRQDHTAQIGKAWDNAMLGKSIYANEKGYLYNEFIDTKSITKQDDLVTFTNANDVVRGGVAIEKFDRETKQATPLGQATFSGVTFTITNKSDEAVVVNGKTYKPGEVVMSATTETVTDKNGMVRSIAKTAPDALPYGHYEIREKVSSVGYLMDEESSNFVREFSIGYQREGYQFFTKEHKDILDLFGDGKGLGNQVIREDFHFIKKDEDTMERMGRIVFLMTSKTTGESHILVTDENGEFNSSAWQTNETAGILHSENTNVNDPDSPITNGAIVKDANGNYKVVKPELLNQKSGVWFTGLAPDKVKWAKDGKSYDVNGVTVPVRDDLRAFPYDTYEIKELRSKDNEGYKLITATVTLHEYGDHKGRGIDIDYGTLDNKPIYVATKLLSKTTNDHVAPISKSENFVDTLSFMNLTPKKEYKTIAELRIVDENGKDAGQAARVEKTFTPKMPNGEVEVAFDHVDLSKLVGGMKLVAIQTIYDADGVVISHADLTDEDQTVSLISIGTKAKGDVEQEANATNEKTTIVDTVSYKGLPVGKEYTLRAELHYQEVKEDGTIVDGGIVKDANGKDVTQTVTFTPKEANGETEMTFTFATPKDLGGKNVVAFEYLEKDKVLYATHADITDEAQTVHFPKVGTTLVDAEDGDKVIEAVEEAKVVDTVKVENLTIGKEYTVDGKLHIKELGKDGKAIDKGIAKDKDGKESYAKTTFVAEKTTEMVKLTFTVDGRELAGQSLVAFENLYRNGVLLGSEADIENADQTVDIMKMGTTLTDMATKSHTVSRAEISKDGKTMTVNLIDHIVYENVPLGKEIVAKGKLMVPDGKDVEKATALLDENAKEIVGETRFTPSERNGEVEVHFTFTLPADTDITKLVAFETFEQEITDSEGKTKTVVIGRHEDLHDEAQTVSFMDIKTTLTGADKKAKEVKADSKVELIDTVDYTNAVVGEEYTITGEMHRKGMKDGKVVDLGVLTNADGKPVTATTTFVAKEASGTVALSFMVDTSKMKDGEELVAFEKATQKGDGKMEGGIVVAKHEDITDASQTVVVKKASTTPNTVTDVTLETAVHTFAVPVATLLALSMVGLSVLALYRKRKEDAE